jgi:hypothetical protein
MNRLTAGGAAAAVLVLTACGGTTGTGTTDSGGTGAAGTSTTATGITTVTGTGATTVTGRFLVEGGPVGAGERPIRGTVTFTGAGRPRVSVPVGRSGTFSVALAPGIYHVSGRSPNIVEVDAGGSQHETTCSQPLTVHPDGQRTLKITLTCIVP